MNEDEHVSYDRRNGCIGCGSLTFSNEYFKAFNVCHLALMHPHLTAYNATGSAHNLVGSLQERY